MITDYYGWGLSKNDEYLLGAALPEGKEAICAFECFKQHLQTLGYEFGTPQHQEATRHLRPHALPASAVRIDGTAYLLSEAGDYVALVPPRALVTLFAPPQTDIAACPYRARQ